MDLGDGFRHFIASAEFKTLAKRTDSLGSKYRGYKNRFLAGTLKEKAITKMLEEHGYTVTSKIVVTPPK